MAKNYRQRGNVIDITAPTGGVTSGVGVLVGQMFGVALTTVAQTLPAQIEVTGVHELAKLSALAFAVGDAVYWDDTLKQVNATSTAQKEIGYAVTVAANPSSTVWVRLQPTLRTSVAA